LLPPDEEARFETRSGVLTARRADGWIEMDFPSDRPSLMADVAGMEALLGVRPVWVGKGRFDLLAELESEEVVRNLRPDLRTLAALPYRGLIATALSAPPYDFVSRFFAPACGIDEDPVTGSAHCTLGPYWQERLGRDQLIGVQASARGGEVRVRPRENRVILGGQAVTVLRGELL
jgi:PhzF family phenazine biosynthesis protein